jgi:arylesterase/paraoxonase
MIRFLKRLLLVVLAVVLVVVLGSVAFLYRGGAFTELTAGFEGTCSAIPTGAGSAEDIQIDQQTGIAYLSAYDRRAVVRGETVTGTILQLDTNRDDPQPMPALSSVPQGFKPHGLSLVYGQDGRAHLYVISHLSDERHTVEHFVRAPDDALFAHVDSIENPLFNSPNDLVATAENLFFVANDSGAQSGFQRATEILFARPMAPLVRYDNGTVSVVRNDLAGSSGINADDNYLYVSETLGKRFTAFSLKDLTGEPLLSIDLPSSPDNIDVASDGSVWVAAHANTFALIKHFGDATSPAPSQVFRIAPPDFEPQQVFLDLGETLSAGSVGATYGSWLVMGSITEPKILLCRLPD